VIGDPTEAEDLTQEAFLLLFRKIHTFRGEPAFSAWLQRLAVSVVLEATPDPEDEMLTGWWLRWR
jgi:RNA polymerase sigma-70 factor, ECF subfamily